MKDKKNIDRLFREKFKDFEAAPQEKVWTNIKEELHGEKRRGLLLPLWGKIAGAAAVVALIVLLGQSVFVEVSSPAVVTGEPTHSLFSPDDTQPINRTRSAPERRQYEPASDKLTKSKSSNHTASEAPTLEPALVDNEQAEQPQSTVVVSATDHSEEHQLAKQGRPSGANHTSENSREPSEQSSQRPPSYVASVNRTTGKNQAVDRSLKNQEGKHPSNKSFPTLGSQDKTVGLAKVTTAEKSSSPVADSLKQGENLLQAIAEAKAAEKVESLAKEHENGGVLQHLRFRPNLAPIYYNSMSGGSPIDPKFANNNSEGEVTMSYGINVAYAVSDRLQIRSGISRVNMSYNTQDIAFASTAQASSLKGLNSSAKSGNLAVFSSERKSFMGIVEPAERGEVKASSIALPQRGQLNQQFSYIEVPFEVEYALLNERFSISLIGGASTLFLNDNAVHIKSAYGVTDLGTANNLNSVSFTTNLGLGFGYQLTENLNLNIEPTFKYQLDAFSGDVGGFQPYYFGVYSGISFQF